MASECHFQKDNYFGLGFIVNEDLVREMTIGHPPQREEITLRTSQ